ncbi:hypothetical protein [Streptomyces sp. NPDC058092]|uniref:hypothetical protein n=1 Tax=Streptomyces sp. NPDC058092 TaxID=3346336 RepID=UPI0036F0EC01
MPKALDLVDAGKRVLGEQLRDGSGEAGRLPARPGLPPEHMAHVLDTLLGSGRVNVAASLDSRVDLSGPVDFGMIPFEAKGATYKKLTRTLTVSNDTDAATTVKLAARVTKGALADGTLTFGQDGVTVPAGGSTEVPVVLDPNLLAADSYMGEVTATTADGATAHAALGFVKEAEQYELAVGLKDREGGAPDRGLVVAMGLDNDYYETFPTSGLGSLKMRVPRGTYAVFGGITTGDLGYRGGFADALDLFSLPEVTVADKAVAVTADATRASDFRLDVAGDKRPLQASTFTYQLQRTAPNGRTAGLSMTGDASPTTGHFGAVPTAKPRMGTLSATFYQRERQPLLTGEATGRKGFPLTLRAPGNLARFAGTKNLELVDIGGGSPEELAGKNVKDKAVLVHNDYPINVGSLAGQLEDAGAAAVLVARKTDRSVYVGVGDGLHIPFAAISHQDGKALAAQTAAAGKGKAATVALHGRKESAYAYSGQWTFRDGIPADLGITVRREDFAKVTNVFHGYGKEESTTYVQDVWGPEGTNTVSERVPETVLRGQQRDDFVYAKGGLTYQQHVGFQLYGPEMHGRTEAPRPAGSTTEDWFGPALHAAPLGGLMSCNFCSTDLGIVPFPGFAGDSDPEHYADWGVDVTLAFRRDGKPIEDQSQWIVKDKAAYQLDIDVRYDASDEKYYEDAKATHAQYSFTADAPRGMSEEACKDFLGQVSACEPLPVITTHYRMSADPLDRVRAGTPYSFTLDGYRATGWKGSTKLAGAKVSVSYDAGRTWHPATVERADADSFRVSYRQPKLSATNGYVAVKAELWDDAGSRTVETLDRAYTLK